MDHMQPLTDTQYRSAYFNELKVITSLLALIK